MIAKSIGLKGHNWLYNRLVARVLNYHNWLYNPLEYKGYSNITIDCRDPLYNKPNWFNNQLVFISHTKLINYQLIHSSQSISKSLIITINLVNIRIVIDWSPFICNYVVVLPLPQTVSLTKTHDTPTTFLVFNSLSLTLTLSFVGIISELNSNVIVTNFN